MFQSYIDCMEILIQFDLFKYSFSFQSILFT